jgi:hypothetical protein
LEIDGCRHTFELARLSPRLAHGTPREQAAIEVSPSGYGLHWPLLDEDLSVDGLLAGNSSTESAASIATWLKTRRKVPSTRRRV